MRKLSKSRLISFRQCAKRLWLEMHHPELREDSSATMASFAVGHTVGAVKPCTFEVEVFGVDSLSLIAREKETVFGGRGNSATPPSPIPGKIQFPISRTNPRSVFPCRPPINSSAWA